jgi:hypothetical protein
MNTYGQEYPKISQFLVLMIVDFHARTLIVRLFSAGRSGVEFSGIFSHLGWFSLFMAPPSNWFRQFSFCFIRSAGSFRLSYV